MTESQTPHENIENRALLKKRYSFGPGNRLSILGSKSVDTGSLYWPPRIRCPRTGGLVETVELPTEGTLWAWTFVSVRWPGEEHPNEEYADEGYGVGIVYIEGGATIPAVLVGNQKTWQIGNKVRACELPFTRIDGKPKSILAFEEVSS